MSERDDLPTPEGLSTLAGDFERLDHATWQDMAAAVLNRGRPEGKQLTGQQAEDRLRFTTLSGVPIDALYTRPEGEQLIGRPGVMPFTRGSRVRTGAVDAWQVRQWHDDPDVATTHREVLADLERGATGLWFQLGANGIAVADLPAVLEGVMLDLAPVAVSSDDDQLGAARALLDVWRAAGHEGYKVTGSLGLDRLGAIARGQQEPAREEIVEIVRTCLGTFPTVRSLTVDSSIYYGAGAAEVEELALAMASAVEYLRSLEQAGLSVRQSASQIEFRVAASADQFLTIAKLRALRRLWARICEVSGIPDADRGAVQHAVTTPRMYSRDDPWVNILRATTATFAAAVGGAESITVLPYDHVWGRPIDTSRRLARNTQVLLAEESNLGRVTDPGGGGWYLEELTRALGDRAWELFQRIEQSGGMAKALHSGLVTEIIEAPLAERDARLATRKLPLTGVSMFPKADEAPLQRTPRPATPGTDPVAPLRRDAEVFEALRDRTRTLPKEGAGSVLVACLGTRRDFGPRETFTSNLLRVAGIEPALAEVTEASALADAVRDSGATVAVIASSAKVYAQLGADAIEALRAAGVTSVFMAGRVKELGEAPAATPDAEIFDGMDVTTFLSTLLDTLGAQA